MLNLAVKYTGCLRNFSTEPGVKDSGIIRLKGDFKFFKLVFIRFLLIRADALNLSCEMLLASGMFCVELCVLDDLPVLNRSIMVESHIEDLSVTESVVLQLSAALFSFSGTFLEFFMRGYITNIPILFIHQTIHLFFI